MGYIFLVLTIICESAAVTFMKLSNGFQHKLHASFALVFYALSFFLLTFALKHLPMGWTNAIWAGASTILVVLIGIVYFNETINLKQGVYLGFIIIGLVGLHFTKIELK